MLDNLRAIAKPKFEPRPGRYKIARRWSPARGGTPGKGHKNKCEPRRGGIKRGSKMPHCFKMPQTPKTRAHPGSELPSPRLATLACYAVAGRFATVLAIICHHRFPGFHFLFCCYTGVRGFESSLSTPSQAVRLRSLHRLPNVRRPYGASS